ncbi:hypothetical protein AKL15_01405 [Corynebacterium glutamicum]|nr:hypothetical protein AUO96_07040 [Corynebacterium glutamicum]QDX74507.1 hypothetical protein AKL15_01405 [Corynebacterium glutamicum]QDX77267.1 hypothetical protein AKL16_01410 [Corynebacterium glutamicum]TWS34601.1 hypothetical protein AKJ19_08935 [Corynebacterium glutamicum]TWS38160.1 hypothetical protein AKJ20_00935 [Corynebacterium glutamicum]
MCSFKAKRGVGNRQSWFETNVVERSLIELLLSDVRLAERGDLTGRMLEEGICMGAVMLVAQERF